MSTPVQQYQVGSGSSGPNIDVNLFPNAVTQGINQGNAQDSTASAIAKGITSGIEQGIRTIQGIQQIQTISQEQELNKAKLAALGTPEQQKADAELRRKLLQDEAVIKHNEALTSSATQESTSLRDKAVSNDQAAKANQDLQDIKTKDVLNTLLGNPAITPDLVAGYFSRPEVQGMLQRATTQEGQAIIGNLKGKAYPDTIKGVTDTVNAVATQRNQLELDQKLKEQAASHLAKKAESFTDANNLIQSKIGITTQPGYDGRQTSLVRKDSIKMLDDGVTPDLTLGTKQLQFKPTDPAVKSDYTWVHNGKLISGTQDVSYDMQKEYQKELDTHQQFYSSSAVASNNQLVPDNSISEKVDPNASPQGDGLQAQVPPQEAQAGQVPAKINQNILDNMKAREKKAELAVGAQQHAQNVISGTTMVAALRPNNPQPTYLTTTQATPVPPGVTSLTQPTPFPPASVATTQQQSPQKKKELSKLFHDEVLTTHTADLLGVGKEDVHLAFKSDTVHKAAVDAVNKIPQLYHASAALKAIVAEESGGNPNAQSNLGKPSEKRAKGLTQLMDATAKEVGVTDPFNVDQNLQGGLDTIINKYNRVNDVLNTAYTDAGYPPPELDPRLVYAAYNGGERDIKTAIKAGNLDYEDIQQYIQRNHLKSPSNFKQNSDYADKILSSSIAFMKGGNASDDLYMRTLIARNLILIRGVNA